MQQEYWNRVWHCQMCPADNEKEEERNNRGIKSRKNPDSMTWEDWIRIRSNKQRRKKLERSTSD